MKRYEMKRLVGSLSMTLMLFQIGVTPCSAVEHRGGFALRQNALMFKRPGDMSALIMPESSVGTYRSALRVYEDVYWKDVDLRMAVESGMSFMSSPTAPGGMGDIGGLFGTGSPLRRWDLTREHVRTGTDRLTTGIERLDVTWRIGAWDIDAGRQPVTLGTSHFLGVLDVIAPFAPGDPDATYKPGVDAVRVRRMVGMTGEAEIIAVGAGSWEDGAVLGRLRMAVGSIDIEAVGGRFRRRGFGGVGWEGGLGEVGLWGEVAAFQRRTTVEEIHGGWSEAAFSAVAGVDVNLPADTDGGCALMFQDFGARAPEDLTEVYDDAPFTEGWAFLASSGYGLVTLHREMHPLVNADLAGILNLVDGSTLWQPMVTVSVGDNTDLSLYGWLATGGSPRVGTDSGVNTVEMRSEFGAVPGGGGFYARWFF